MSVNNDAFSLKLLTMPKTVGVRKLRGFAASLGGSAELFSDASLFVETILNPVHESDIPIIAVVDDRIPMNPKDLSDISKQCNLILVHQEEHASNLPIDSAVDSINHDDVFLWAYIKYPIHQFFQSTIIRIAINQLCHTKETFSLSAFTRWGNINRSLKSSKAKTYFDSITDFIAKFKLDNLVGNDPYQLCMFLDHEIDKLHWTTDKLQISTDGHILTCTALCSPGKEQKFDELLNKLQKYNLSVTAINARHDGKIELSNITKIESEASPEAQMILIFNGQNLDLSKEQDEELGKAV